MSPYLKEERYIRLIQCFLIPDQMLIRKDVSHVLSEEQSVLEHTSSGVHTSIGSEGVEIDLLYDLFDPKKLDRQGNLSIVYTLSSGCAALILLVVLLNFCRLRVCFLLTVCCYDQLSIIFLAVYNTIYMPGILISRIVDTGDDSGDNYKNTMPEFVYDAF